LNGERLAKRFVFWGGYAGNNLGDEAILWAVSQLLRKLEPSASHCVLIPDGVPDHVEAQYAAWQIEVIKGRMPGCLDILRTSRLIVGGGQMVDDTTLGWPVGWSSLFITINAFFRQRPLVLCIGAEPLKHALPRFLVRHMYSLAKVCTCRDDESTSVLRDAGISARKVWTTRDVVFSLDRKLIPQYQGPTSTNPSVAIVVAYDPNRVLDTIPRYTKLIDALLEHGMDVQLVAHDLRMDYDVRARDEIHAMYKNSLRVTAPAAISVDEVLAIYSRSDAVISGRMHPLILASLAGTLPIAFGGKAKVQSLIAMSGIPALAPGPAEQQALEVRRFLDERSSLLPAIASTVDTFRINVEAATERALKL
jgi:polysaccharide pyruvyl transferase WcaK-like protein